MLIRTPETIIRSGRFRRMRLMNGRLCAALVKAVFVTRPLHTFEKMAPINAEMTTNAKEIGNVSFEAWTLLASTNDPMKNPAMIVTPA
jgi:hypothetical protein